MRGDECKKSANVVAVIEKGRCKKSVPKCLYICVNYQRKTHTSLPHVLIMGYICSVTRAFYFYKILPGQTLRHDRTLEHHVSWSGHSSGTKEKECIWKIYGRLRKKYWKGSTDNNSKKNDWWVLCFYFFLLPPSSKAFNTFLLLWCYAHVKIKKVLQNSLLLY